MEATKQLISSIMRRFLNKREQGVSNNGKNDNYNNDDNNVNNKLDSTGPH